MFTIAVLCYNFYPPSRSKIVYPSETQLSSSSPTKQSKSASTLSLNRNTLIWTATTTFWEEISIVTWGIEKGKPEGSSKAKIFPVKSKHTYVWDVLMEIELMFTAGTLSVFMSTQARGLSFHFTKKFGSTWSNLTRNRSLKIQSFLYSSRRFWKYTRYSFVISS